jgi:hypothetical protein
MNRGTLIFLLLASAALAAPEGGADDVQETIRRQGEQIERLEKQVGLLKAAEGKSAREREIDAYLAQTDQEHRDAPPTVYDADRVGLGDRVRLGGYFSLEYRDEQHDTASFDFHRLVLRLQAEIADGIRFDSEIEFEGGGADVSYLDDNEILVEYAELRFGILEDKLDAIVGCILMPWGRFNLYHDDPLNDLTDRPLVSRYIGATAFGQPGVAVAGTLGKESWFVDYKVAWVQGFGEEFTTADGARSARQGFREDNNANKQIFGRFVVSVPARFVDVLEIGASGTWGKWDDDNRLADYGYGLDLFVKRGPFELIAEYMWLRAERAAGAPDTEPGVMDGWYVQVAYHFFPASWRGKHKLLTQESTFTLVVRIEDLDLNHDTTGTTFRDDLFQTTLGLNFRPVERTVWKLDFVWIDSEQDGSPEYRFLMSWATYF